MAAIFTLGNRASVEDIRGQLADPPSYSSVRVLLARLEKKGHVCHTLDGVRYIYSARTSPAAARRSALQQYVRTFFGGSLAQMVTALVRQESWTDQELAALKAEIEQASRQRKSAEEKKK